MKITIEKTNKIVHLDGVPARVWEGKTESGIAVHCYVTRIAVALEESPEVHEQFRKELQETKAPTAEIEAIPLRMIL